VDREGHRFTNESAPYGDVAAAMYAHHAKTGKGVPAFMVFDARYRRYHLAGPVAPGIAMPDGALSRRLRERFLVKAETVAALAEKLGVDPAELEATLTRFNAMAVVGVDEDFGRGESASDGYYGDPTVGPNPCMAPIERAPFYAIPIFPGDLGTKGGLVTDPRARVLRADGTIIDGLFATGNAMASVMGPTYPGAGGTIGPALTFGFVAAETALSTESIKDGAA
jgi:3-oxosteroid 1-dehydrogenase